MYTFANMRVRKRKPTCLDSCQRGTILIKILLESMWLSCDFCLVASIRDCFSSHLFGDFLKSSSDRYLRTNWAYRSRGWVSPGLHPCHTTLSQHSRSHARTHDPALALVDARRSLAAFAHLPHCLTALFLAPRRRAASITQVSDPHCLATSTP